MVLSYGTSAELNVLSAMGVDIVKGQSGTEGVSGGQCSQSESRLAGTTRRRMYTSTTQHLTSCRYLNGIRLIVLLISTAIISQCFDKRLDKVDPGLSYIKPQLMDLFVQILFIPAPTEMPAAASPRGVPVVNGSNSSRPCISMTGCSSHISTSINREEQDRSPLFFGLACCASETKELSLVTDPASGGIHKGTSWDVLVILQALRMLNSYSTYPFERAHNIQRIQCRDTLDKN
ncbi:unnamed protein product [Fusarium graminearum]|nr:unnamed protein product [Fusarium graminearum]